MKRAIVCSGSKLERTDKQRPKEWRKALHIDPYVEGKVQLDLLRCKRIPEKYVGAFDAVLLEFCPFDVYFKMDIENRRKQTLILQTRFWKNVLKILKPSGFVQIERLESILRKRIRKQRNVPYCTTFLNQLKKTVSIQSLTLKTNSKKEYVRIYI